LLGLGMSGHAALMDMGDGTIYDTDIQLSWLKDANYAMTSGYDADGRMSWAAANTWANSLNDFGGFAGLTGWRLPTVVDTGSSGCNFAYSGTDCGYNVDTSTSEMAHLYYDELGNLGYYNTSGVAQAGWGLTNTGPFTNLQPYLYWSGTEYAPHTNTAWTLYFSHGAQDWDDKTGHVYALAVHPGERSTSVPEPGTLLLLGSGLAGIAVFRKRLGRREG